MWPNTPASQSALKAACTYAGSPPSAITIHDYGTGTKPGVLWHWAGAHAVAATAFAAGASTITVSAPAGAFGPIGTTCPATATGACDRNHSIEGPGIPPGDFIANITGAGPWTITLAPNKTVGAGGGANSYLVANTAARNIEDGVTNTGTCGAANIVCSASADFTTADIGKTIGGGTIGDGVTIMGVTPGIPPAVSKATLSSSVGVVAATGVGIDIATGNPTTTDRVFTDVKKVDASHICTAATAANGGFALTDVELPVTMGPGQTGIPANARITATGAANAACGGVGTSATVTPATVGTTVAGKMTIVGKPTKTAPVNGEVAGTLGAELVLNPATSPGSPPCSANRVTGFSLPLAWYNPGSYITAAPAGVIGGSAPLNFSVTGMPNANEAQLIFQTRSLNCSGFVVQKSTNWDVVFGFLPVAVGVCTGSNSSSEYNFLGATTSQLLLPQQQIPAAPATGKTFSTGPAGTAQVRATTSFTVSTMVNASVVLGTATTVAGACKLTEPRVVEPLNPVQTNADLSKSADFKCGN
jgi:hypothetical protein